MKHSLKYLALVATVALLTPAVFACAVPSSPGVAICTPANGQSVAYPAQITAAAAAQSGRSITAMAVYANGTRILLQNGVHQINDIDYALKAGTYNLVVNAWDSTGALYQAKSRFTIFGGQTVGCTPSAPGVQFCSPANGSIQPTNNVNGSVGARGDDSPITRLQVLLDGLLMQDGAMSNVQFTAGMGAGTHTMTAKAWDQAGHVYTSSTTFKTYYDGICSPKGCAPGVVVSSPTDGQTVSTSFPLRSEVQQNPAPITAMRAYLDGQQVAASSGPSIIANVSATPGQHQLIVQAWDTQGKLYRTVESINVQ